jgi:hypothetical protein
MRARRILKKKNTDRTVSAKRRSTRLGQTQAQLMNQKFIHLTILFSIALLVIFVYVPGINGPYVFDDGENITLNEPVAISSLNINNIYDAALSNNNALKRPLAALSFGLNHYFAGGFEDTLPFKITNLFIHLCNSILVYVLTLLLLKSPGLRQISRNWNLNITAGLVAAAWSLHPIQLTSVLYVVQRMTSLSALFVLAGLIVFLHGRHLLSATGKKGFPIMYAGITAGTVLGLGAKENAILLPLFALTIEYVLFARDKFAIPVKRKLWFFYIILLLAPLLFFSGYSILHPEFITNGYLELHFTLFERLLTQSRILWIYVSLILYPSVHRLGLFHDDINISHGFFDPLSTLPALIGICGIVVFAITRARQYPVIALSVLWFISGHALESSIFPLQIAYEHRNYLPSLGIIFAVVLYIRILVNKMSNVRAFHYAIPLLLIFILGYSTWNRAYTWSDISILAETEARNHPESGAANSFAARVNLHHASNLNKAIDYVIKGIHANPDEAGLYIDLHIYLAMLSAEINQALSDGKTNLTTSPSNLKIQGLPSGIKFSFVDKTASLTHESVDGNAVFHLLRNKPITVHGLTSLENLSTCIRNQPEYCGALQKDAHLWLRTATDNPQITARSRSILLSHIAQLYASENDLIRAYEYINLASLTDPSRLAYQLGRIEYLIKLGKLNEAKQFLDNYNHSKGWSRIERKANANTINQLLEMYQAMALKKHGS